MWVPWKAILYCWVDVIKINQHYALGKRPSICHPPLPGFRAVHAAQRRSQSASDLHALLYQNKQLLCRAAHTAKRYVKQPLIVPHKSALCSLPCRWPLYAWWCYLSLEHCTMTVRVLSLQLQVVMYYHMQQHWFRVNNPNMSAVRHSFALLHACICTATESICDLCMHYMQSTLGQNLDPDWTATGSFQHHSHTFAIEWHCLARPHRVAKLTVMVTIWSTVYCVCDMYACITRKMNDLTEKRRHAVQQAAACRTCLKPLLKCRFVQTHAAHAYAYSWSCHCLRMHHVQFCRVCWLTMMFVCLDQVPRLVLQHRERHMPSSLDHVMGD